MSATTALFVILCVWLLIGILCSFVMARRGHHPWSWMTLGALMGPLVVSLALAAARREPVTGTMSRTVHEGRAGAGPVSVLVGVDGSPDSEAAACEVARLFGPQLGCVTLATVVDYDAAEHGRDQEDIFTADARRLLAAAAQALGDVDAEHVILTGRPADALLAYAIEHDVDLLATGSRGRGLSTAVLGSVAERLVRQREMPVLVAGIPKIATTTR